MPLFHDRRDGSIKQVPEEVVTHYPSAQGEDFQKIHDRHISDEMVNYDAGEIGAETPYVDYGVGPEAQDQLNSDWSDENRAAKKGAKKRKKHLKNLPAFPV